MSELMKRTMQNITIASEVPNFASASASKVHQDLHQNYIRAPVLLLEEGRQLLARAVDTCPFSVWSLASSSP
jgi:hypothetical protein